MLMVMKMKSFNSMSKISMKSKSSSFNLESLELYHDDSLIDLDDEMWDETNDDSGYES